MAVTREDLLKYLGKKTRADLSKVGDDTELFSSGMIDSFAMVDLLTWLEKKTGRAVDPAALSLDNLDSIARILEFAAGKKR